MATAVHACRPSQHGRQLPSRRRLLAAIDCVAPASSSAHPWPDCVEAHVGYGTVVGCRHAYIDTRRIPLLALLLGAVAAWAARLCWWAAPRWCTLARLDGAVGSARKRAGMLIVCCRCARARRWNHFQRRRPFTGRRWPCPGPGGSSRSTSYSSTTGHPIAVPNS